MLKKIIATLLLLCSLSLFVTADLPVHCLFHQIQGSWELSLTAAGQTKDVVRTCTLNSTITTESKVNIRLTSPDVVRDETGMNIGFWTLIYDQGFEIVFTVQGETQERKFLAYFHYTEDSEGVVTSNCDRTFVGWFHDSTGPSPGNWGCFQGKRRNGDDHSSFVNVRKPLISKRESSKMFKNDRELIQKINNGNFGWTAKAYPHFESMTVGQVQKLSGNRRSTVARLSLQNTAKFLRQLRARATTSPVPSMMNNIDLPESFDWRNVNGENYVSPVRNQLSCGSCYAFAALSMLESRLRIKTKNQDKTMLSPQDVVDCSVYSEGCEGGFQYLVSKYGEDFGFVSEDCYPYVGSDGQCTANKCKRLFATDYAYVGGYYGGSNEKAMMREIYLNGPVVVGFEVLPDFRYYNGGVYRHTKSISAAGKDPQFYEINHGVLAVGWGVDPVQGKYWICKNSWGDVWGVEGYFLIARGENPSEYGGECGVESDAVSAVPLEWV